MAIFRKEDGTLFMVDRMGNEGEITLPIEKGDGFEPYCFGCGPRVVLPHACDNRKLLRKVCRSSSWIWLSPR
jgi:hypothetical protein